MVDLCMYKIDICSKGISQAEELLQNTKRHYYYLTLGATLFVSLLRISLQFCAFLN